MNTLKSTFFLITGLIACPCHLPVTLPILLALTAGTALGAFLADNVWLVVAVSTAYFIAALALGFSMLGRAEKPNASSLSRSTKTRARVLQRDCCAVADKPIKEVSDVKG
jgi:hypothetical protein